MNIQQQIALYVAQAHETDEQRAERLNDQADAAGLSEHTLYDVEEELRRGLLTAADTREGELQQVREQLIGYAQQFGMPPEQAEETLSPEVLTNLLTLHLSDNVAEMARLVHTLNRLFDRHGVYQELGTEPLTADDLAPAEHEHAELTED